MGQIHRQPRHRVYEGVVGKNETNVAFASAGRRDRQNEEEDDGHQNLHQAHHYVDEPTRDEKEGNQRACWVDWA